MRLHTYPGYPNSHVPHAAADDHDVNGDGGSGETST